MSKPWDSLRKSAPIKAGKFELDGSATVTVDRLDDGAGPRLGFGRCEDRSMQYMTKRALTEMAEFCTELAKQL